MPRQNTRSLNRRQTDYHASVISGVFQIQYKSGNEGQDVDSDDSDGEDENDPWLDFEEMMEASDSSVRSRTPKDKKVQIKDDSGKIHSCTGKFPLTQVFWKVTVKVSKGWLRSAPTYAIRTDVNVQRQKLVTIFLTDCLKGHFKMDVFSAVTACFEAFCCQTERESTLSFTNLEETLQKYVKQEHLGGCCLGKLLEPYGQYCQEDHSDYIKQILLESDLCTVVLRAASHPTLVKAVSNLLPYTFIQFLHKLELKENECEDTENIFPEEASVLQQADEMARQRPWEFVFRDIIYAKLKLQGTEATLSAYENAGYLARTPQTEKDAIYIYEVLKVDARKNGHTYMNFKRLRNYNYFGNLGYQINGEERWNRAFEYLERNNVIKRESFNGEVNVFLRYIWQAEIDIVNGLEHVLKRHQEEPLRWVINYRSPDFESICSDSDQLKALKLIASSPISVLSGKGGCGKTTVITKLLKHMYDQEERKISEARQGDQENTEAAGNKAKDGNGLNSNFACEDLNLSTCQSRNDDTDLKDLLKPLTLSCINSSCQNPTDTANISKDIVEPKQSSTAVAADLPEDAMAVKPSVPSLCSKHSPGLSQDTSLDSSGHILPQDCQTQIKNEIRGSQPSEPDKSKEERHMREVISDLIKIGKLAKDVEHPLLRDYKKRILLTAPTGKAARLLGCKANLPSATLHSVIMSWRVYCKMAEVNTWNYSRVEVLVVDECSLVSVRLFACVINILRKKANLRKIVLLGDVRQLPSIEAGNFLQDVFKAFGSVSNGEFSPSVELTKNHRSESSLIVENAGKISTQVMPTFDKEQRFHLVQISDEADDNERDEAIRYLLKHAEDVRSHVGSQFISFRNAHCEAVNELCCQHYNKHSIKTASAGGRKGRKDFRVGDKICLGKNAMVTNSHQIMLNKYLVLDSELQEAVNQAVAKHQKLNLEQTGRGASSQGNLSRMTMGITDALSLFEGDDAVFDRTVNEMIERDHQIEEAERERAKQGQRPSAVQHASRWKTSFFMGDDREKLCNGEVFFIMDEIDDFNRRDQNTGTEIRPVRYLVLSDRDPYRPRVVCVRLKVLRKECRMKHSWARTIHTFQGSESDSVVYVLGKAMPQNWQHVYTAVTRGKKSVYIIGSWAELHKAIVRKEYPRCSRLRHRLEEMTRLYKTGFLQDFNAVRKMTTSLSMDDMDSNDSWVHTICLDQDLEDSTHDENDTDLKNVSNSQAEDNDYLNVFKEDTEAFGSDRCDHINDLNQETHRRRKIEDDFNVFNSFEDNEELNNSSEALSMLVMNPADFISLSGPQALGSSPSSGTFFKEILHTTSPVTSSIAEDISMISRKTPSSPKGACPINDSVILFTPPRPSRSAPECSTGCEQESLPNRSSGESSSKLRRTESPFNTPIRDKFTSSLKLGDDFDSSDEENSFMHRRKSIRKNLDKNM